MLIDNFTLLPILEKVGKFAIPIYDHFTNPSSVERVLNRHSMWLFSKNIILHFPLMYIVTLRIESPRSSTSHQLHATLCTIIQSLQWQSAARKRIYPSSINKHHRKARTRRRVPSDLDERNKDKARKPASPPKSSENLNHRFQPLSLFIPLPYPRSPPCPPPPPSDIFRRSERSSSGGGPCDRTQKNSISPRRMTGETTATGPRADDNFTSIQAPPYLPPRQADRGPPFNDPRGSLSRSLFAKVILYARGHTDLPCARPRTPSQGRQIFRHRTLE